MNIELISQTMKYPCPDIAIENEEKRQQYFDEVCDGVRALGYMIVEQKRQHNQTFDKKGQKTTLIITVERPK